MPYDLRVLSRVTQIALVIQAVISALSAINGSRMDFPDEDARSALIALGQVLAFVVAWFVPSLPLRQVSAMQEEADANGVDLAADAEIVAEGLDEADVLTDADDEKEAARATADGRATDASPRRRVIAGVVPGEDAPEIDRPDHDQGQQWREERQFDDACAGPRSTPTSAGNSSQLHCVSPGTSIHGPRALPQRHQVVLSLVASG